MVINFYTLFSSDDGMGQLLSWITRCLLPGADELTAGI